MEIREQLVWATWFLSKIKSECRPQKSSASIIADRSCGEGRSWLVRNSHNISFTLPAVCVPAALCVYRLVSLSQCVLPDAIPGQRRKPFHLCAGQKCNIRCVRASAVHHASPSRLARHVAKKGRRLEPLIQFMTREFEPAKPGLAVSGVFFLVCTAGNRGQRKQLEPRGPGKSQAGKASIPRPHQCMQKQYFLGCRCDKQCPIYSFQRGSGLFKFNPAI